MPRPENPALKKEMLAQATRLFSKKGYSDTSYSDIARASGITKGLLQYYFPKKEQLATAMMEEVLHNAIDALGFDGGDISGGGSLVGSTMATDEGGHDSEDKTSGNIESFEQLYEIGQVFFEFLLASEGTRRFLQDIVGDMKLVDSVLAFNLTWALDYAEEETRSTDDEVVESVVFSMGGFYSLLYYCLAHERRFDVGKHLRYVMFRLMRTLGFDEEETNMALDRSELSSRKLKSTLSKMKPLGGE
ncbi:MAG: TetR/AcrR family transcriptional regulator [Coriobacteriales bacterium]